MPSEFGFAIVGWGSIAPFHAKAIAELPDAKLVAVQTTNPGKAEQIRKDFGSDVVVEQNLSTLLKRSDGSQ